VPLALLEEVVLLALKVPLVRKDLRVHLDLLVLKEFLVRWVLLVRRDRKVTLALLAQLVGLVILAQKDPLDLQVPPGLQESQELLANLGLQVGPVPRAPVGIQEVLVQRAQKETLDRPEHPDRQGNLARWVV